MFRKSLSTIAFAALFAGTITLCAEDVKFARGDLDGDGQFTNADVSICLQWIAGAASVDVLDALDVDRDGFVTRDDALLIERAVVLQLTPRPEKLSYVRGDLDGDGRVSKADYRLLSSYLRGTARLRSALDAADLNDDGRLDSVDLQELDRVISGVAPTP